MLADPLDVINYAADKAGISICTFASLSEKADDWLLFWLEKHLVMCWQPS